jgi:hypothetical protein
MQAFVQSVTQPIHFRFNCKYVYKFSENANVTVRQNVIKQSGIHRRPLRSLRTLNGILLIEQYVHLVVL